MSVAHIRRTHIAVFENK